MHAIGFAPGLALGQHRQERGIGFRFPGPVLPPGATLQRASAASVVASGGQVATVAADAARFDHDPATGRLRGLLLEAAGSNLVRQSSALQSPPWVSFGAVTLVAAAAPGAPDGSDTVTVLRLAATAGGGGQYQQLPIVQPGTHSVALWARRAATNPAAAVRLTSNDSVSWNSGMSVKLTLTDEWQRLTGSGAISAGSSANIVIGSVTVPGALDTDCVGDVELWGVQVEQAASIGSDLASGAEPGTRAADLLTLDWGALGVADGVHGVRYGFDDGTSQTLATTISEGLASVPVPLARRHLRSARIA